MGVDVSRFDKFLAAGKYPFVDEIVDRCGPVFGLEEVAMLYGAILGIPRWDAMEQSREVVTCIREFMLQHGEIEFTGFCKVWTSLNLIAICEPNKVSNGRVYRRDKKKLKQKYTHKFKLEIDER